MFDYGTAFMDDSTHDRCLEICMLRLLHRISQSFHALIVKCSKGSGSCDIL